MGMRYGQAETASDPLTFPMAVEDQSGLYAEHLRDHPVWRHDDRVYLFRMDDILEVNRNPVVLGNGDSGPLMGRGHRLLPLDVDGDIHLKFRKLLDPLFAPKSKQSRIARLEPVIRKLANELIDEFIDQPTVEAYEAFCVPLPTRIFISLLGLPVEDLPFFLEFKDSILRPEGETAEEREAFSDAGAERMYAYLNDVIDERERTNDTRDDLVNGMRLTEVDGMRLTRDEILNVIYLLVIAGLDTITASLSMLLVWLARHPAEQQRLRDEPSIVPAAVEELMRFQSPVQWGHRFATEPIDLPSGGRIEKGEYIQAIWAAANLDEEVFPRPLEVDFDRQRNRHIAFASGIHRCLGSHLARLELVIAMEEWHRRIASYEIASDADLAFINFTVRSALSLPVAITKA